MLEAVTPQRDTAPPIVLTIAGSDSSGGAGIQADLKAFSAMGTYGATVITAITAQNTRAVTAVHEVPRDVIEAQIDAVFGDLDVGAVKIGMLGSSDVITAVASAISDKSVPIVLDPVMVAKSGDPLLQDDAVRTLRSQLVPMSTLLTPNLPEAARLTDQPDAEEADQVLAAQLIDLGPNAVLLKGGHAAGPICTDLLLRKDAPAQYFKAPRISTRNTHGTGCTLSAAIAAGLASGLSIQDAVAKAHQYLHGAIKAADTLSVGSGHGPVHHFHQMWDRP